PLDALPERTRTRLAETLLYWLALHGQRRLVAERLHIHPQTVRYRVGQLRDLFGETLDDPEARFELELVLRATIGLRPGCPVGPPAADGDSGTSPGASMVTSPGPGPGPGPGPEPAAPPLRAD
ncbi:helix-turn-helix domain-containing protein, partial [Frankia sp. EI5c]|uniref:helix-turn-helix domain-containing protein n=1 Tax=Frankia sp. EI5c TaxID=683316 RepID=UPI001F5B3C80